MSSTCRTANRPWTPPRDFRVICECQRHAIRERTLWRRTVRGARVVGTHLQRHGVALLAGIPIAFGTIGIPMEAMNSNAPSLPSLITPAAEETASFPVFTTRKIRQTFLHQENAAETFTLDFVKQDFFKNEVPYGSIIYREARRNGLPPELVAAVVEAESDFRVRLVSQKNAQGLMQIVPETGRLMGCTNPFDPSANIAAGTKYLRYLTDRFGDQRMALAAYNAGEGNIERFGGIPPFAETRDYVQRVSVATRMYRQRIHNRYLATLRTQLAFAP